VDPIYKRLAIHLDKIPNGFPATESGVELKLLAELFSAEEAKMACRMSMEPQAASEIGADLDQDEREITQLLNGMGRKGLIEISRSKNKLAYNLMPFVVGFYERQNARISEKFAHLFEEYYHEAFYKAMTKAPSVHRVIPIEQTIPIDVEVMPYERASEYLDGAASWGVLPCICRVQKRLIGEPCDHSEENCVVFSSRPGAFERTDAIRSLTKEEAREILVKSEEEGLVHSTGNFQDGLSYICNCCTCSCGVLRGIAEHGSLNSVGRSDFYAVVDADLCTGCEVCLPRCQFKALSIKDDKSVVQVERCFGCGLCITTCPVEAISLKQKPAAEIAAPPITEADWYLERAQARGFSDSSSSE